MTQEIERYIDLAQSVAAHAQAGTLSDDTAMRFCRVILPALMVELDLARRVDARLSQMFPAPVASQPEPAPEPARKKKAKRATRKKKERSK